MSWSRGIDACPGLFYGTPARDGYLIRLRVVGGWLNPEQGEAIAQLIAQSDTRTAQITNRGNLQIRGIQSPLGSKLLQKFQAVGLAAHNPALDRLRNIMASPIAGRDSTEILDVRPLAAALDSYIQNQPKLAALPSKFSIGLDGGGRLGIGTRAPQPWAHRYNEIQLSAIAPADETYLHLALGAGHSLEATGVMIPVADCVAMVAALAEVYLEYLAENPQPRPRLKHLLQDWGTVAYLTKVSSRLPHPPRPCPVTPAPSQTYAHLGSHPQPGKLVYVGAAPILGQLSLDQWQSLIQLAITHGSGRLHLTPWQSVIIVDVPAEQAADLTTELVGLGLSTAPTVVVACAGKPGCASAATHTQDHARQIIPHLGDRPVNIHLTGCPKSCAQASPADITLLGIDHQTYQIYLDQKPHPQLVSAPELAGVIRQLLKLLP